MIDMWQEIWESIRHRKLRVILTGFSISWGIFMLIILLGSGNGLKNSFDHNFSSQALNKMVMWGGTVSIPFQGTPVGKQIKFQNADYIDAVKYLDFVKMTIPEFFPNIQTITYKNSSVNYRVKAIPDYFNNNAEKYDILEGRFINAMDMKEKKKVIIISKKIEEELMGSNGGHIGKLIFVNNMPFKLIGIYKDRDDGWGRPSIYIPFSTGQNLFDGVNKVTVITFILKDYVRKDPLFIEKDIVQYMALRKRFHPQDQKALRVWNTMENFSNTYTILNGITLFIWIIGIGTLIAGIVGVSNIMIIVVNEKTKEIGIRKALGAQNISIMKLVIFEALFITSLFGYFGLFFGTLVLEAMQKIMGNSAFFRNPEVDVSVATSATILLIVIGCLAGFFPALRASKIKPVEAMRYE